MKPGIATLAKLRSLTEEGKMANDLSSFSGQVVLIVGAASVIGRSAVHLITSRGGKVVIADLDKAGYKYLTKDFFKKINLKIIK